MTASPAGAFSNEPLWWCVFGAGAVCAAVLLPPLILLLGLGPALGWVPHAALDYARISGLLYRPLGFIVVVTVIALPVCHAMYRIRHSLHDLQLGRDAVAQAVCYGSAMLISVLAVALWLIGVLQV